MHACLCESCSKHGSPVDVKAFFLIKTWLPLILKEPNF